MRTSICKTAFAGVCCILGSLGAAASYTELTSISTTSYDDGSAFIVSDYTPSCSNRIELCVSFPAERKAGENWTVFCSRGSSAWDRTQSLFLIGGGSMRFDRKGTSASTASGFALPSDTPITIVYDAGRCQGRIDDGTTVTTVKISADAAVGDYTPGSPLVFLASHTKGTDADKLDPTKDTVNNVAPMTVYWVKIYDEFGSLKRWFVPARDDDAAESSTARYGLYEVLLGKFCANRGTMSLEGGEEVGPVPQDGWLEVASSGVTSGKMTPAVGCTFVKTGDSIVATAEDCEREDLGVRSRCTGYELKTYDRSQGTWSSATVSSAKSYEAVQGEGECRQLTWRWVHEMRNASGDWVAYDASSFDSAVLDGGYLDLTGAGEISPLRQLTIQGTTSNKVATVVHAPNDVSLGTVVAFTGGGIVKTGSGTLTLALPDYESWPVSFGDDWTWNVVADKTRESPYDTPTSVPEFHADGSLPDMKGLYGFNVLDGGLRLVGCGTNRVVEFNAYFANGRGWDSVNRKWSFSLDGAALRSTGDYAQYYVLGLCDTDTSSSVYDMAYPTNWSFSMVDSCFDVAGFGNARPSANANRSCFHVARDGHSARLPATISIALTNSTLRVRRYVSSIFGSPTSTTMYMTNSVFAGKGLVGSGDPKIIADSSVIDVSETYGAQAEGIPQLYLRNGSTLRCGGIHFNCTTSSARLRCDQGDATVWFQSGDGVSYGKANGNGVQQGEIVFGTDAGADDRTVSFGVEEDVSHWMGLQVTGRAKVAKIGKGTLYMDQQVVLTSQNKADSRNTGTITQSKPEMVAGWTGPLSVEEGTLVFSNGTFRASMPVAVAKGATLRIDCSDEAGTQALGTVGLNGGTLSSAGEKLVFTTPGFTVPATATTDGGDSGLTLVNAEVQLADGQSYWTVDFGRSEDRHWPNATLPVLTLPEGASFDLTKLRAVNDGERVRTVFTRSGNTIYAHLVSGGMTLFFR